MRFERRAMAVGALALVALAFTAVRPPAVAGQQADTLPTRLADDEFWRLSREFSEPDGYFQSDNLLSNEIYYPSVMPELLRRAKTGGVYLGVGPEQNFNYITAIRPKIVFITDVRRGNLHTQLMYKALIEMSKDRADFVGRLFTKKRPAGLTEKSSAAEIINAYWDVVTEPETAFRANSQAIRDQLTKVHNLPLAESDLQAIIDNVYYYFWWYGPSITYSSSSGNGRGNNMVNYADLMAVTDNGGGFHSYLATEERFQFLKDLESRNLIVPVVGNFAGPKALRAVGSYVREHGATVTAFYLSNVEQYLSRDGLWGRFCANVATMPLDDRSTFIRSESPGNRGRGGGLVNYLGDMMSETRTCGEPVRSSPAGVLTAR